MKYELIESPTNPGHWHVEAFTEEGECIKAVFSGPEAKMRAEFLIHNYEWLDKLAKALPDGDYRMCMECLRVLTAHRGHHKQCSRFTLEDAAKWSLEWGLIDAQPLGNALEAATEDYTGNLLIDMANSGSK